ncbi:MAG TPA: NUDIX domain-containing protein [Saprospiraceae bacterium]|nr:NUDIX domain-containing protein [Saprospiraceae bacterium]
MKILSKKAIHEGWSTLHQYILEITNRNGNKIEVFREIYNSGDGAAVLLYDNARKVCTFIRQFRLAAFLQGHLHGYILECCAGMLDNQDPETAILKEIEEETGIRIKNVTCIGSVYATPGAHMEKLTLFTAAYSASDRIGPGGGSLDENEEVEVVEIDYTELREMLKKGVIEDAKTLILVQYGFLNGLLEE